MDFSDLISHFSQKKAFSIFVRMENRFRFYDDNDDDDDGKTTAIQLVQ